jgi:hypothetical protein
MNAKYDDKTLREAFAALADDAPPAGELCFSAVQIWEAIETRSPVEQRLRIVDHMAVCPACAEAWRMAVRMGARPQGRFDALMESLRRWVPRPSVMRPVVLGGTTAAALFIGVGLFDATGPKPPPLPSPNLAVAEVNRGSVIEALVPLEELIPRESFLLQWTPIPGATFDLTMTTASSDPIAYLDGLTTASQIVPEELLQPLGEGATVQWFVEATLANGERTKSPTFISLVQ